MTKKTKAWASSTLTWAMLKMMSGNIERGNLKMLNSEIATNALAAVKSLPVKTYMVNVARETWNVKILNVLVF